MSTLEAEVQHLRQRNQELQAQLDALATAPASGATARAAEATAAPPEDGIELTERDRSVPAAPHRRRGAAGTDGGGRGDDGDGARSPSRAEAGFDNEGRAGRARPGAAYAPLSIEHGDEEAGGPNIPDAQGCAPPLARTEDGDESDDLIHDDSSHNKHRDKGATAFLPRADPATFPPFGAQLRERAGWLIGLLFLQSCSSFIIANNEAFLEAHMVIVQFLTMLVGAGGNAGNQAAVGVIRALAVGVLNDRRTLREFLRREARMAVSLSALIGLTGFVRAWLFRTPWGETVAVTASVALIVLISVALGSTLPLAMRRVGIDPAHSSTTIQVIMDIMGVLITVGVSSFVLSWKMFKSADTDGE